MPKGPGKVRKRHLHKAISIAVSYRPDCAEVACSCGETLLMGTWWEVNVPPSWDTKAWYPTLQAAITLLYIHSKSSELPGGGPYREKQPTITKCKDRHPNTVLSTGHAQMSIPTPGECGKECLPGMVVCLDHASDEALRLGIQSTLASASDKQTLRLARKVRWLTLDPVSLEGAIYDELHTTGVSSPIVCGLAHAVAEVVKGVVVRYQAARAQRAEEETP